jgi:hypothetical protein
MRTKALPAMSVEGHVPLPPLRKTVASRYAACVVRCTRE